MLNDLQTLRKNRQVKKDQKDAPVSSATSEVFLNCQSLSCNCKSSSVILHISCTQLKAAISAYRVPGRGGGEEKSSILNLDLQDWCHITVIKSRNGNISTQFNAWFIYHCGFVGAPLGDVYI